MAKRPIWRPSKYVPKEDRRNALDINLEENKKQMNEICKIIENSVNKHKDISIDEIIDRVIRILGIKKYAFMQAYIESYKFNQAHLQYMSKGDNKISSSIVLSNNIVSYMTDKDALKEIFDEYLKAKEEIIRDDER